MSPARPAAWKRHRGRVASLTRSRSADDSELIEARAALAAERFLLQVEDLLARSPELDDEQRARLAKILVSAL